MAKFIDKDGKIQEGTPITQEEADAIEFLADLHSVNQYKYNAGAIIGAEFIAKYKVELRSSVARPNGGGEVVVPYGYPDASVTDAEAITGV